MEINNIHENSNNYNKYIKDSSDEAKSAGKTETILRAMTADDLPAVERIEQTCFSDAWSEKLLSDMLESEWDEAWVLADEKNSVIGYANFRFLAGEGELMRIAVLPEYRGHGESKKLMDRLEISSREKEAPDLTLEVRAGNTPAINLYKFYGFQAEEILDEKHPDFDPYFDPKCNWALRHMDQFPVEVNRAPYEMLLRVPGIGVTGARRITMARRSGALDFSDLQKMRISLKRARYFLTCKGRMLPGVGCDPLQAMRGILHNTGRREALFWGAQQLSLFDPTEEDKWQSLTGQL